MIFFCKTGLVGLVGGSVLVSGSVLVGLVGVGFGVWLVRKVDCKARRFAKSIVESAGVFFTIILPGVSFDATA